MEVINMVAKLNELPVPKVAETFGLLRNLDEHILRRYLEAGLHREAEAWMVRMDERLRHRQAYLTARLQAAAIEEFDQSGGSSQV